MSGLAPRRAPQDAQPFTAPRSRSAARPVDFLALELSIFRGAAKRGT